MSSILFPWGLKGKGSVAKLTRNFGPINLYLGKKLPRPKESELWKRFQMLYSVEFLMADGLNLCHQQNNIKKQVSDNKSL
jgi:hypothetical protein